MTSYSTWTNKLWYTANEAKDLKSSIANQSEKAGGFVKTTADSAGNMWKETSTVKKACLIGATTTALAPLAIVPVLGAAGFTSAGVAAGSLAASMQTATIASGSFFALCQSAGALGAAAASTFWAVGLAAGTTAGAVTVAVYKVTNCGPSNGQGGGARKDQLPQSSTETVEQKMPHSVPNLRSAL